MYLKLESQCTLSTFCSSVVGSSPSHLWFSSGRPTLNAQSDAPRYAKTTNVLSDYRDSADNSPILIVCPAPDVTGRRAGDLNDGNAARHGLKA